MVVDLLRGCAGEQLLVVGVGNPSRGDDAAGLLLGRGVAEALRAAYIAGEDVPEHYTDQMRTGPATQVLFVDAVDMGMPPGHIALLRVDDLDDTSISTHKVSLAVLARLLEAMSGKQVRLLGIQPRSLGWGHEVSEPVRAGVERFVRALTQEPAPTAGEQSVTATGS